MWFSSFPKLCCSFLQQWKYFFFLIPENTKSKRQIEISFLELLLSHLYFLSVFILLQWYNLYFCCYHLSSENIGHYYWCMEAFKQVASNYAWKSVLYFKAPYLNIRELVLLLVFKKNTALKRFKSFSCGTAKMQRHITRKKWSAIRAVLQSWLATATTLCGENSYPVIIRLMNSEIHWLNWLWVDYVQACFKERNLWNVCRIQQALLL